ncbi:hypothetical protein ATEIFO6365_0008027300 [Aspergillus terreus]|uniref:Uncharacterized protein n=1 Tax=Aspergillus terreus TaxID=33178 RepID=A0A5M3Z6F8_ASPTE|nr:hypothetical protein ATETN484_0010028200 [Aspergillus terreus]GFF18329.1 hypothetical protein ATEIFO6365_0008027300 [Aspergillus terreus]
MMAYRPAGAEINYDRGIAIEHDVGGIDVIMDDSERMKVPDTALNAVKPSLNVRRGDTTTYFHREELFAELHRVHSFHQGFTIFLKTKPCYFAFLHFAPVINSNMRVRAPFEIFTGLHFLKRLIFESIRVLGIIARFGEAAFKIRMEVFNWNGGDFI